MTKTDINKLKDPEEFCPNYIKSKIDQKLSNTIVNLELLTELHRLKPPHNFLLLQIREGEYKVINFDLLEERAIGLFRLYYKYPIEEALKKYRIGDLDLVINVMDEPRVLNLAKIQPLSTEMMTLSNPSHPAVKESFVQSCQNYFAFPLGTPVVSLCAVDGFHYDFVLPHGIHFQYAHKRRGWRRYLYSEDFDEVSYEKKLEAIYWKGSLTGGHVTPQSWKHFPRAKLVIALKLNPDPRIQLGLIEHAEYLNNRELSEELFPFLSRRDPYSVNWKYKFLLDLDGHSYSQRLVPFLDSNSVVIRPKTMHGEFYFEWLKSNQHYYEIGQFPAQVEIKDLQNAFVYLNEHPHEARVLTKNSGQFIDNYISTEKMILEWAYFLARFSIVFGKYNGLSLLFGSFHRFNTIWSPRG